MIVPVQYGEWASFISKQYPVDLKKLIDGWAAFAACLGKPARISLQKDFPLPWTFYRLWVSQLLYQSHKHYTWFPPLALYVDLSKLQPHFTFLAWGTWVSNTFSFGSILRLYYLKPKYLRRNTKRAALAFRFLTKYFSGTFRTHNTEVVIFGYAKRYNLLLNTAVAKFSRRYANKLIFAPRTLSGFFLYRRVKGIKKRIRKKLKSLDR